MRHLRQLCMWLIDHDVRRFAGVTQQLLDDHPAARRQTLSPTTLRSLVKAVQRCAAYSPAFSDPAHRFSIVPRQGRPTPVVAGSARRGGENLTARIPEQVTAPLLRVALLYLEQFAADILAARAEAPRRLPETALQVRESPRGRSRHAGSNESPPPHGGDTWPTRCTRQPSRRHPSDGR